MLVYITCGAVAQQLGLALGFNTVDDSLGADIVSSKAGYDFNHPEAFPEMGFCDPGMTIPEPHDPPPPPPPAPPPPPPAPAPTTLTIGPEDTVTRIDVDGDGRADVLVVTDRPPQNP